LSASISSWTDAISEMWEVGVAGEGLSLGETSLLGVEDSVDLFIQHLLLLGSHHEAVERLERRRQFLPYHPVLLGRV